MTKYPNTLGSPPFDKWIMFSAMSGHHVLRNNVVAEATGKDRPLNQVGLYLPETALLSATNIRYEEQPLGGMAGALAEFGAQGGSTLNNILGGRGAGSMGVGEAYTKVSDKLKTLIDKGIWTKFFQAGAAEVIAAKTDALAAVTGTRVNPRTDLLYSTQEYRLHDMEFLLIPRNQAEAWAIDAICYFFNYYMLPRYQNNEALDLAKVGAFMVGFPYEFEISMFAAQASGGNQRLDRINRIGRSVLTSVGINHAGGEKTAFIKDNGQFYPVATRLHLMFKEVRLLARGDKVIERAQSPSFDNNDDDPKR
jgi:hypothetical protein